MASTSPTRRRALDVTGPRGRRGAAAAQHGGGAGVGAAPPAVFGGLVDGAAHDRVAEAEASGQQRRLDQLAIDELIECGQRLGLVHLDDLPRELGLERVTDHRGGLDQLSGPGREALQFGGDERVTRAGSSSASLSSARVPAGRCRPAERISSSR